MNPVCFGISYLPKFSPCESCALMLSCCDETVKHFDCRSLKEGAPRDYKPVYGFAFGSVGHQVAMVLEQGWWPRKRLEAVMLLQFRSAVDVRPYLKELRFRGFLDWRRSKATGKRLYRIRRDAIKNAVEVGGLQRISSFTVGRGSRAVGAYAVQGV